jgi:orotidine-5'-phosphate decarboxylase
MDNFADRLLRAIDKKENLGIVGLDPDVEFIPQQIQDRALDIVGDNNFEAVGFAFLDFNKKIIDDVADLVPAVKLQIAFYEIYKSRGIVAFDETVKYARKKGLVVIEDGKRNDVGNTARKYSEGHLGRVKLLSRKDEKRIEVPSFDLDALTVNGYLGSDCVLEFVKDCKNHGKGIFVLDKTSNPSAGEIQDEVLESKIKLSERMAQLINKWGEGTGGEESYRSIGAVVGATYASDAQNLRKIMASNIFLVPGLYTQGGQPEDIPNFVNKDGRGAIVNSSRGIIAAYRESEYLEKYGEENFYKASREKTVKMKEDITEALRKSEKSRW